MKGIIFFLLLSLLLLELTSKEYNDIIETKKLRYHFCGVDYLNFKIQKSSNSEIKNINLKTRKLSTDYQQIRIFVDTTYLEEQAKNIEGMENKLPNIKRALNKAVEGMGKLLEVEPFQNNVYTKLNSELLMNHSIYNWDKQLNDTEYISSYLTSY